MDHSPFEAAVAEQIDFTKVRALLEKTLEVSMNIIIMIQEDFVGLAAVKELQNQPVKKSLRLLKLEDVDVEGRQLPGDPDGMEAIWQGDKVRVIQMSSACFHLFGYLQIIGQTTSGCYSPYLQCPLAFGYIDMTERNQPDPVRTCELGLLVESLENISRFR